MRYRATRHGHVPHDSVLCPGMLHGLFSNGLACMQRLAGGPELPKQMAEMDRELRTLQQQVGRLFSHCCFRPAQIWTLALGVVYMIISG